MDALGLEHVVDDVQWVDVLVEQELEDAPERGRHRAGNRRRMMLERQVASLGVALGFSASTRASSTRTLSNVSRKADLSATMSTSERVVATSAARGVE